MPTRLSTLLFALLMASQGVALAQSQTGKIQGTVTDASTGEPLPGVNVVVVGTGLGTATDVDGNYFILRVPPGLNSVQASFVGFVTVTKTDARVFIDQTTPVDFELTEAVLETDELVVTAERPPVEVDLTGSKERMSGEEIANSWANTVLEAIETQAATNINGGIRGGFGLEDNYYIDGLSLRDNVSGGNLTSVNTTAISELEVLTGGWNAEYGRAMGAIINIVTKSAMDRIQGTVRARLRPAGKYHWGRNIYSQENYEWATMATLDYWTENTGGGEWVNRTPQERLDAWRNFISGDLFGEPSRRMQQYAERATWETEATIYGPITDKLGFLLSGKYLKDAPEFPAYLTYSRDWNYQGKFDYQLSRSNRLELSGMVQGFNNTEGPRLSYWSSEDSFIAGLWGPAPFYYSGYSTFKYWPYGTSHIFQLPSPPEYMRLKSGQLKWTHVFNPASFLDVQASYTSMDLDRNNFRQLEASDTYDPNSEEFGTQWDETMIPGNPLFLLPPIFHRGHPGVFQLTAEADAWLFKAAYTNQINRFFQVKTGAMYSPQYVSKRFKAGAMPGAIYSNHATRPDFNPWDAAAYAQGKIEVNDMVINAGLRLDAFNANTKVAPSIFDPALITNMVGVPPDEIVTYSDEEHGVDTETKAVLSPRFGISHPVTENTVLHFSYGHFNQRPAWQLIGGGPTIFHVFGSSAGAPHASPDTTSYVFVFYHPNTSTGNPDLSFEKIIQYELGFDQHIPGIANLDVTVYYRDGKSLTSLGVRQSPNNIGDNLFGVGGAVTTEVHFDAANPLGFAPGGGRSRVTSNGGYVDVRGLELSLHSLFLEHARARIIFNRSFVRSGQYGFRQVFITDEEGNPVRPNTLHGVSLGDKGLSGTNSDTWNPTTSVKLILDLFSPPEFGPALGFFHPLGDWRLNAYYVYASGHRYTYHSPGDFSTEPNNRRWKPHRNTNLRLSKGINMPGVAEMEFSIDVHNVFNSKRLNFLTGNALETYHEEGTLPVNPTTGEESEWDWYNQGLLPRQVYFGLQVTF